MPALDFLDACPRTIDAQFTAVPDAVAAAPPPRFSGGGKWEAMHGAMGSWYEIRLTGSRREQLRLFCLLETELATRWRSEACLARRSDRDYKHVRDLGAEHKRNYPRRLAT